MTEPTDRSGDPPPDAPADFAGLDAREGLFTGALQGATRLRNMAEATQLQVMLAGFEAMLLEEQAIAGEHLDEEDPLVRGFTLHQANELHVTFHEIKGRLQDGRRLRDSLPRTWAALLAGSTSERHAAIAAKQSLGLTADALDRFDAAAAEMVQSTRPAPLERDLGKLRDELAPEAAIDAHKRTEAARHVRARAEGDGGAVLTIHSTAADIAGAYDKIRQEAVVLHGREGETRTLGQLMADRAIDRILKGELPLRMDDGGASFPMERLGSDEAPERKCIEATILVTVSAATAAGAGNAPAAVAGVGSIDAEVARRIVEHTKTWTRVGIDPIDRTVFAIDSHERYIPAGLKKLLHVLMPTCMGDDCGLPAHRCDLDHAIRFEDGGRTRWDNLQPLCRRSHQGKDLGFADVRIIDGEPVWANKWGGRRIAEPAFKVAVEVEPRYPEEAPF